MKRLAAAFAVLALALPRAAAADEIGACVDGADKAQQLRDKGKLIEARTQLIACGSAECPGPVAKQCAKWLQQVEAELPTISLRVRDPRGADVVDVSVTLDDAPLVSSIDGRPLAVDPGPHRLAFKRGDTSATAPIVVRAGEKNRLVDVTLVAPVTEKPRVVVAPPPPPPPPPVVVETSHFHFPWASGVFYGLGVASFVATGVLVAMASSDASTLRQTCAPNCNGADVDAAHTKLVVANVAMGVGIAALIAGTAILIIAATRPRSRRAIALFSSGISF